MLKNASGIALLIAGLLYTGAGRPAAQASQDSPRDKAKSDRLTLDLYLDMETVSDPQISPDGAQIIYTRGWVDKMNDRRESALWIMNADGGRNRFLVQGLRRALVADRRSHRLHAQGEPQGHADLRALDGRRRRDLADHARRAVAVAPSRGRRTASGSSFSMLVEERRHVADQDAEGTARAPSGPRHRASSSSLNYRRDRTGFTDNGYRHVFVVPASGGTPRQVTSGNFNHTGTDWTPDGKQRSSSAACAARRRVSVARVRDLRGRRRQRRHPAADDTARGRTAIPTVSPDGKRVAYTGYDWTTDTWLDSKIYVMNIDGIEPAPGVGRLGSLAAELQWSADGSGALLHRAERRLAEPLLPAARSRRRQGHADHQGHADADGVGHLGQGPRRRHARRPPRSLATSSRSISKTPAQSSSSRRSTKTSSPARSSARSRRSGTRRSTA